MKRIFGYLFIVLAALLTLAFFASIPALVENLKLFFKLLIGKGDAYDTGLVIGRTLAASLQIAFTIFFWVYGKRWIKPAKTNG